MGTECLVGSDTSATHRTHFPTLPQGRAGRGGGPVGPAVARAHAGHLTAEDGLPVGRRKPLVAKNLHETGWAGANPVRLLGSEQAAHECGARLAELLEALPLVVVDLAYGTLRDEHCLLERFGGLEASVKEGHAEALADRQRLHAKLDDLLTGAHTVVFQYFVLVQAGSAGKWRCGPKLLA